ncbi:MAG: helix-turn-helix domain-containing protein [Christensenellales bacterium]
MELEKIIAKNLKELRNQFGLTQKEIANKLGVAYQTYQAYELGTNIPTIKRLIFLADFYDVSLDYLVNRKEY